MVFQAWAARLEELLTPQAPLAAHRLRDRTADPPLHAAGHHQGTAGLHIQAHYHYGGNQKLNKNVFESYQGK